MSLTQLKRHAERGSQDQELIYQILDEGLVAHIAFEELEHQHPVVIPCGYGRDGNRLLIHGSTGSRMFRTLAAGAPASVAVTLLDAIVVAMSPFNSSMNYRSVVAFGAFEELKGEQKERALAIMSDHLVPGLWENGRATKKKELAATMVLALELDQVSAKARSHGTSDDEEDIGGQYWAGVVPIKQVLSAPITSDYVNQPVPTFIKEWLKNE
jgi:nitroimidazol reductase NimA-like FMN-containing flavoprotein (pyridoxamine 5'-phosphate oxidase superfamily)